MCSLRVSQRLAIAFARAGRPVIFLIDEFVVYLAKQSDVGERNEMANLHTLMMAVNASSNCLMVVTNPSGSKAYGKETATLDAHIRKSRHTETTQNVSSLLSRVTEPIVPVEKNDFVSILRKRLVDSFDQKTAGAVETYLESKFAGMVFKDFYPFHPLLIDVLYDRVSLYPDFQKTRDALKIIALAIKGIITHKESAKFHVRARQRVAKLHPFINVLHHPNVAIDLAFQGTPKRSAATATSSIAIMQRAT